MRKKMKKQITAAALALTLAAGSITAAPGLGSTAVTAEAAAKKKVPSVKKLRNAIVAAYGDNYAASMSLTTDELNERFGLSSKWYTAAAADIPMMSAHVDTLVIVKSKNSKTKKKIKAKLKEYRQAQIDDAMQYPTNLLKVQASRIYTKGDYVFFFMLGFIDSTLEETGTEEEQIAAFKEQNQIAVDAVKALYK
jgi:hypothetical protein